MWITTSAPPSRGSRGPEHDRLLADIRAGKLDAVVVWDVDRLYRQPRELEPFVDACEAAGLKTLGSVGGDINLNDESALMLLRFKVAMAAAEVAKIRKRIVRQKQERAEKGLFNGGIRPFGFEADGVTQKAVEAALIREAADRILEGSSLQSIVRDWNGRRPPDFYGWTLVEHQLAAHAHEPSGCWASPVPRRDSR